MRCSSRPVLPEVYVFPGGYEGHHMAGFPAGDGWRAAGLPME